FREDALDVDRSALGGVKDSLAYGLPECSGREFVTRPACRVVANPGCHASAAILALYPLFRTFGQLHPRPTVVSVTGSSGSGARPARGPHPPERFATLRASKPLRHQHEAEIVRHLWQHGGAQDPSVDFVPVSGPFARGIGNVAVAHVGKANQSDEELTTVT